LSRGGPFPPKVCGSVREGPGSPREGRFGMVWERGLAAGAARTLDEVRRLGGPAAEVATARGAGFEPDRHNPCKGGRGPRNEKAVSGAHTTSFSRPLATTKPTLRPGYANCPDTATWPGRLPGPPPGGENRASANPAMRHTLIPQPGGLGRPAGRPQRDNPKTPGNPPGIRFGGPVHFASMCSNGCHRAWVRLMDPEKGFANARGLAEPGYPKRLKEPCGRALRNLLLGRRAIWRHNRDAGRAGEIRTLAREPVSSWLSRWWSGGPVDPRPTTARAPRDYRPAKRFPRPTTVDVGPADPDSAQTDPAGTFVSLESTDRFTSAPGSRPFTRRPPSHGEPSIFGQGRIRARGRRHDELKRSGAGGSGHSRRQAARRAGPRFASRGRRSVGT